MNLPVRSFVRKKDAVSIALEQSGAEILEGDLLDFQSVSATMKDVSRELFIYTIAPGFMESAQ